LEGSKQEKRHYQDEWLIHQTAAQHFELGETVGFITILIPHKATVSAQDLANKIQLLQVNSPKKGMGVKLLDGQKTYCLGVKNDLRMDMSRETAILARQDQTLDCCLSKAFFCNSLAWSIDSWSLTRTILTLMFTSFLCPSCWE
jgi:hypothetical protein